MAEYTYKCVNEKCDINGMEMIIEQSMKDDTITVCPDCKEETFQKIIRSVPGFRTVKNGLNRFRKGK